MRTIIRWIPLMIVMPWVLAVTSAHLTWTVPIAYTDGTALPAGDIDHYTIAWSGPTGAKGTFAVSGAAASAPISAPCGTVQYTISVTTTPTATYPNATSAPAGPVPFATGVTCAPNPPGGLAVQP